MAYVLEPARPTQREVRRVAVERLDGAIERLGQVMTDSNADVDTLVHEIRKRCKASRGLARLVKPALGDEFRTFDRAVRDAANQLSSLRDAHVVVGTFDALLVAHPDDEILRTVRNRQSSLPTEVGRVGAAADDERIATARALLVEARHASNGWKIPRGFDTIEAGIVATYRQGRSALRRAQADPTDHRFHEWRKAAKYLWYQMQLVHDAAPSVLGPLVDQLDLLAEALGDDHDLAVLVELLDDRSHHDGTPSEVAHVRALARDRQHMLRRYALRSGATIYAEPDDAFARRIARYWHLAVDVGPEVPDQHGEHDAPDRSLVERERKFLVEIAPDDLDDFQAVELRQGYLAADEGRSVRVRDAGPGGCTLTIKAGSGAERTELEWPIERREFDAAWVHTTGRRVEKSRHRIPFGAHTVELDVFAGALDGLMMAEVEFTSSDALQAFEPPVWFGREVTDDGRYTNASLALNGLPAG
jgi:CYTH domain-containing protein/CHAD domain-containing protein